MEEPRYMLEITSLDPTWWHDADILIVHACFQALKDCVEKENILNCHIDWNHSEMHRVAHAEIAFLYQWWCDHVASDDPKADRLGDLANYEKEKRDADPLNSRSTVPLDLGPTQPRMLATMWNCFATNQGRSL